MEGQILVLPKNEVIPKCVPNRCDLNHVWFNEKCYELEKPGPCPYPEYPNVVSVNKTTLDIICTQGLGVNNLPETATTSTESSLANRFGSPKPDPELRYDENDCLVGGYRWTHGLCRESGVISGAKFQ